MFFFISYFPVNIN